MGIVLLMSLALFAIPAALFVFLGIHSYRAYKQARAVLCTENPSFAVVQMEAEDAVAEELAGNVDVQLEPCSQCPEQSARGEGCLATIKSAPDDCWVRPLMAKAYRGKRCALCGVQLGKVGRGVNQAVLVSPDRKIRIEANELAPENLPQVLRTYSRICWNCHRMGSSSTGRPALPTQPPRTPASHQTT